MKKENIKLETISLSEMSGGSFVNGKGFGYDVSYLLGFGFAWMIDYMGSHSAKYGLAFK